MKINGNVNLVKEVLKQQILVKNEDIEETFKTVSAPDLTVREIVNMYAALCHELDGDIVSKCIGKDKYVLLHNGNVVNSVVEFLPDKEISALIGKIITDPHFILMDLEDAKNADFVKEMINKNKQEYPFITQRSLYIFKKDEDFHKAVDKLNEFIKENKNNDFINYEEYVEYAKMAFEETCAFHATMIDNIFRDLIDTVYISCNNVSQCHENINIEELSRYLVEDANSIDKPAKKEVRKETKKVSNIPSVEDMDIPKVPDDNYLCYDLIGQKVYLKIVDIQGYNVIVQKKGENKYTTLTNVIYDCVKQASTKDLLNFYELANFSNAQKNKAKAVKNVSISKTGTVYVTFDNDVVAEISITVINRCNEPLISVRIV